MAQTKITKNEIETQEAWIAPTLVNSWVYFGSPYYQPGYMKDSLGFVHLRGLIKSGTMGTVAFTLPAGYRPTATAIFPSASNNIFGAAWVDASGAVNPTIGNNGYFSIEGITFKAEQ